VAIRLLPIYEKPVEVVTSVGVASPRILDYEVSRTIVSLRERCAAVRRDEVHHVRGRLGNLTRDQEKLVESLSRGIIEKVLQAPVAMVVNAAAANQSALICRDRAEDVQSAKRCSLGIARQRIGTMRGNLHADSPTRLPVWPRE